MRNAIYLSLAALAVAAFFTFRVGNYEMLHARFLNSEIIMPIGSFAMLIFILGVLTGLFGTLLALSLSRARGERPVDAPQPRPGA